MSTPHGWSWPGRITWSQCPATRTHMHGAAPCHHSSLEKRLQNIKIFVSAPFGAGVLSVAGHSVTCGRAGELGWVDLSPRSLPCFPSKKALRCWPSWSTGSPNGVDVGLHEKTHHSTTAGPSHAAAPASGRRNRSSTFGVCVYFVSGHCQCIHAKGSFISKTTQNNPSAQLL